MREVLAHLIVSTDLDLGDVGSSLVSRSCSSIVTLGKLLYFSCVNVGTWHIRRAGYVNMDW